MAKNLADVLLGGREHDLALIEVRDTGTRAFTYGELNAWVDALGRGLKARFEGRPFRVALVQRNSAEYVAIYFATIRAGGDVVPFNGRASEAVVNLRLRDRSDERRVGKACVSE